MKKIIVIIISVIFCFAIFAFYYFNQSMPPDVVIRKLMGLRVAVTFFKLQKKQFPVDFKEVIINGNIEDIPEIKLGMHAHHKTIKQVSEIKYKDTGTWAYVNNPQSPDFGAIFIDCIHKDPKGRYWSWF